MLGFAVFLWVLPFALAAGLIVGAVLGVIISVTKAIIRRHRIAHQRSR